MSSELIPLLVLAFLVVDLVIVWLVLRARRSGTSPAPEDAELLAAASGRVLDGGQLRIEAAAVVSASGWHAADAFLREQRGLTPEASRTLLDSLT